MILHGLFLGLSFVSALNYATCDDTGSANLQCSAGNVIFMTAAFYGRRDTTT